jgi:predicted amidohydrolase YtcJ
MSKPTLYTAGRVHTMTGDTAVTGVLVAEGRVLATGAAADLRRRAVEIVDFGDGVLTPGLVDGHSHPVTGLFLTAGVNLTDALDLGAVRAALAAARANLAPGKWLLGWGLNPVVFGDGQPTSAALGTALDGVPALITLYDGHSTIASPDALRLAGVDGPRSFASSSRVVCDTGGVPTGHLLEDDASSLVRTLLPEPTTAELTGGLRGLLREMAATGYTGTHVMDFDDPSAELMALLEREGDLPLRLGFNPHLMPVDDGVEEVLAQQGLRGRRWRVEGVKLFVDGTVDGGTAWLERPDVHGEGTASLWSDFGRFRTAVTALHRAGVNMAVHCIGDRGVREVLELFGELRAAYGPLATHRIEHIETVTDDVVARFGEGAAAASMHPLHCTRFNIADQSDSWSRRLGPERADRGWRCADIRGAGATLALGSDWPIAPYDPRWIMADALLRRRFDAPEVVPMQPEQGLTPLEALEGFTTHAAAASGEADRRGRIAPGYDADFTVFADDPLTVAPAALGTLPVLATVVEGHDVYHWA